MKVGIGILIVVVLLIGWYGISPIFQTTEVYEALPQGMDAADVAKQKEARVVGTTGHPASGTVRILQGERVSYVRYENFKTINGPDIFVYLAKDLDAKEFVNIGRVRATEGDINYEIPETIDVSEYRYVLVWCRAFGVLFNYADFSDT